jgi:hypothetical protein
MFALPQPNQNGPAGGYPGPMPMGTYTVLDGAGAPVGTEEFRASQGPFGWRYVSTIRTRDPHPHTATVDLTADEGHRPVRIHLTAGPHSLMLAPEGDVLVGTRDGDPVEHPWEGHVDFLSPCCNAVTAARLEDTTVLRAAYVEPVTLELRTEAQRYELLGSQEVSTPVGRFPAECWRYTSLSSGWSRRLWVAGLVVVAYEDLYELTAYEPGRTGPAPLGA